MVPCSLAHRAPSRSGNLPVGKRWHCSAVKFPEPWLGSPEPCMLDQVPDPSAQGWVGTLAMLGLGAQSQCGMLGGGSAEPLGPNCAMPGLVQPAHRPHATHLACRGKGLNTTLRQWWLIWFARISIRLLEPLIYNQYIIQCFTNAHQCISELMNCTSVVLWFQLYLFAWIKMHNGHTLP